MAANPDHGILRFITCGSVDDGKSTLIGRLLFDCKAILADALDALESTSRRRGLGALDLSLLTDGLEAEREQGITIDVAYRYFATGSRKYILGDAPGHEQYTRNMVTAASTADLAVILVDARKGVLTQTRRHLALAHLLGIRHLVAAVNKMDLVDWSQARFEAICAEFREVAAGLGIQGVRFLPLSALNGDGIVERGGHMDWYEGPTLFEELETAPVARRQEAFPFRFPVQWVCRPRPGIQDERLLAGRVEAGAVAVGDPVLVLPAGRPTRVRAIRLGDALLDQAWAGQSAALALEDDLDVSRGDLLAAQDRPPAVVRDLEATLCWLGGASAEQGGRYLLRHGPRETRAVLRDIAGRLDLATLEHRPCGRLGMNDIARVSLKLQGPVAVDAYWNHPGTGAFILIDEATNATVAAGMVAA